MDQPQGEEVEGNAAPPTPADAARRPTRKRRAPAWFGGDWCMTGHSTQPQSYHETLVSPDKTKWVVAMEQEIQPLHDNKRGLSQSFLKIRKL